MNYISRLYKGKEFTLFARMKFKKGYKGNF